MRIGPVTARSYDKSSSICDEGAVLKIKALALVTKALALMTAEAAVAVTALTALTKAVDESF